MNNRFHLYVLQFQPNLRINGIVILHCYNNHKQRRHLAWTSNW